MLQQFSWQSFLIAALILSLIWYAAVLLFFYKTQFRIPGSSGTQTSGPLTHRWDKDIEELSSDAAGGATESDDLMGKPKVTQGVENVQISTIGFATEEDRRYDQIGLIPDLLEELKLLFSILDQNGGGKQEFFLGIEEINRKYPSVGSHPGISGVNNYIVQHALFALSADELDNLWD